MRLILLAIGVVIILAILWDGLRRKKRQRRRVEEDHFFEQPQSQVDEHGHEHIEPPAHLEEDVILKEKLGEVPHVEEHEIAANAEQQDNDEDEIIEIKEEIEPPIAKADIPEVIWFSIIADEEKPFSGFGLLQVLLSNGFRFADDKLFYYHQNREAVGQKLFGLAAATKSGTFDLTNMARFSCKGLVVFVHTQQLTNLEEIFNEMLEVAESLSEDLEGQLYIEEDTPFNEDTIDALRGSLRLD